MKIFFKKRFFMVDQLVSYVKEQLTKGYSVDSIKQVLINQGYSPSVVEGVISSVVNPVNSSSSTSGQSHEKKLVPIIFGVLAIILIASLSAFFIPKLFEPKEALLDVSVTPDERLVVQGGELGFDVEIFNMGSAERFDIGLSYRILDENDNTVLSDDESIAISTSTSHHRTIILPRAMNPGNYKLKVFANYEGEHATAQFSFDVTEKEIIRETCFDGIKNQDESNVDCGGVCEGFWYDDNCHDISEEEKQEVEEEIVDDIVDEPEEIIINPSNPSVVTVPVDEPITSSSTFLEIKTKVLSLLLFCYCRTI